MRQRLRANRAIDSGFTLIELLITVVILGVLAGVVVFAVGAFNNDGVTAACKADVKNVEVASEAYYAKQAVPAYAPNVAALVTGGYLRQAPASAKYTVSYDAATGTATGDVTGGAVTTDCSA